MRLPVHITPLSWRGISRHYFAFDTPGGPSSTAWPATNRAIYLPFDLEENAIVGRFYFVNGSASGNIDLGIFEAAGGTKLVSTGSTAKTPATSCQYIGVTDYLLHAGSYYYGAVVDGTTTVHAVNFATAVAGGQRVLGMLAENLGSGTLPSVMAGSTHSDNYIPLVGFTQSDSM